MGVITKLTPQPGGGWDLPRAGVVADHVFRKDDQGGTVRLSDLTESALRAMGLATVDEEAVDRRLYDAGAAVEELTTEACEVTYPDKALKSAAEIDAALNLDARIRGHRDMVADRGCTHEIGGVIYIVKTTSEALTDMIGASAMIDKAVAWAAGGQSPIDPDVATRTWTLDRADGSVLDDEVTLTLTQVQQMAMAAGQHRDAAFSEWHVARAARQALLDAENAQGILDFDIAAAADWPETE